MLSWSWQFSKFSMITAVNRLSITIDTSTTKLTKNGYAARPVTASPAQSRITPTHSSLVATRNSVSTARGKDSKFACSSSEPPSLVFVLGVVPNRITPT